MIASIFNLQQVKRDASVLTSIST